ncbi:hypothetical protein R5R35_007699 [Gryllus longicercus]|uniref:Uncharacterized protein n=1 Tax=Gryllus longicercus TaxID=2509291 RepID=A0AAN9V971_9ORTH
MMQYELESGESDSETELQEAFAKGIIKPGLNIEENDKKTYVNNEVALNRILNNIVLKLPWVERLDLNSKPAAMAPELAAKLQEEREKQAKLGKAKDPVLNDFERETMFLRQAQAAALDGLSRLKELGIPTKRPDDYFAEMAKTDSHMQKVRGALQRRQQILERAEKVRHIRKMRKVNKDLQKQAKVQKINEKREFLEQVKKYRKKMTTDLDFLDLKPKRKQTPGNSNKKQPMNKKAEAKRKFKNEKYGMGGRKKGRKHNTKESAAGLPDKHKSGNRPGGKVGKSVPRPGKSKRMKQKSGKRR